MAAEIPYIPANMQKVNRRLGGWRSAHTGRLPLPESLWAAELAREHGINPTARALHLEYGKLKQRAEAAAPTVKRRTVKALADGPRRAPCTLSARVSTRCSEAGREVCPCKPASRRWAKSSHRREGARGDAAGRAKDALAGALGGRDGFDKEIVAVDFPLV